MVQRSEAERADLDHPHALLAEPPFELERELPGFPAANCQQESDVLATQASGSELERE